MEKELQRKIEWFEKRHERHSNNVKKLEKSRCSDRSPLTQSQLHHAKKEKLRMRDQIRWLKNLEKRLQKN